MQEILEKYSNAVCQAEIIHSLIYWNQANLFMGPEESHRQSQPREKIDSELLNLQSQNFKKHIARVMELINSKDTRALE